MKKVLIVSIVSLFTLVNSAFSQFSAGYTTTGNVLTFKIKPSVNTTTGFSVIEFFVRYPTSSPSFNYGAVTVNATDFPSMTGTGTVGSGSWEIERNNPAYVMAGYNVDHIFYTAPAPNTVSKTYLMNQVYDVISVPLLGATAVVNMEFVHQDIEDKFYLAITSEVGADLREAALTNYFFPTTTIISGPAGSTIYLSALSAVVPVKFLNFTAIKNNNQALLNWSVENEDANVDRYEIERSLSGVDFVKAGTLSPKNNGRAANSYSFTQDNLSTIREAGVIYFRIKQIDKDGKFVYTEIKSVRLDAKGLIIAVYPNPVKGMANVSFDLLENTDVIISINDAAGKQIQVNQIQGFKGPNNSKIDFSKLSAGSYILKVQAGDKQQVLPLVKAN